MPLPTLTPEDQLFLRVVLTLGCISPSALASRFTGRVGAFEWGFESSYLWVLAVLAVAVATIMQPPFVVGTLHWGCLVGAALAIPVGRLAFYFDQKTVRKSRWKAHAKARMRSPLRTAGNARSAAAGVTAQGPWRVAFTGIFEEVVFRGALFDLALQPTSLWCKGALLLVVTFVFAANHIPYGRVHLLAKLPLSFLAGALTLVTGSVVGAALAHAWFNRLVVLALADGGVARERR